jgi:hypothetical protein
LRPPEADVGRNFGYGRSGGFHGSKTRRSTYAPHERNRHRVTEILRENPQIDPDNEMISEVFRAVGILHEAVRRPIISEYPELDYDQP